MSLSPLQSKTTMNARTTRYQSYYASLKEENLLNCCSGIYPVRQLLVQRIDPQTISPGSQSPEDTLWLEGANVSFFGAHTHHFTSEQFVQTIIPTFFPQFKPNLTKTHPPPFPLDLLPGEPPRLMPRICIIVLS